MRGPRDVLAPALALLTLCACVPDGDFEVVHHRNNGCRDDAPENSLLGLSCVIERCAAGDAPCAVEGDARILRLEGGSLGGDLEIVWLHDGSTERTVSCPDGPIVLPGTTPMLPTELEACRLRRVDGRPTTERLPTLDDVLASVQGSTIRLFLELKGANDAELDARLVEGSVGAVELYGVGARTVVTSFSPGILGDVRRSSSLPTACFAPTGTASEQVLTTLRGGLLGDVDRCLAAGHDMVFVPPWGLDGAVVGHIEAGGAQLGVFGADTADGFDAVDAWRHRVDFVYADNPAMYVGR